MARIVRAVAGVLVLVLLSAGCRVNIGVDIDVAANGAGQVRVEVTADQEVVDAVDLSAGLRIEDLKQVGWEVEGPTPQPDGGLRVVATKPFPNAEGARLVLEELAGTDGPFQGFRLERKQSFARTTTQFFGTVDLTKGIEAFGDPDLRQILGGSDVGLELAAVEKQYGPINDLVGLSVAVRLPGEVSMEAPETSLDEPRWAVSLGQRIDLAAQSSALHISNLVGAVLIGGAGFVLCVVLLNRGGSRRSRQR